MVEIYNEKT
jgi:kinesin family protein 13